jgi:ankyrin repeat protein
MKKNTASNNLVPQRMVRPLNFPPGSMKKQLPTKYTHLASQGDLDALRQLLSIHPEFLNKRSGHNRTFLWEAARMGKLALVRWLVEQGAEINATGAYNHESFVQLSPYCAAIFYKRPEVAEYLRSRGTQIDIFRAAYLGDIEQVSKDLTADPELIHAEDPHDNLYYVPLLSFAVVGGNLEMIEFLLKQGAVFGPYSIQIYLCRGDKGEHPEKIELLLEYHAAVNEVGPKGRTALHYAAAAGYLEVITLLLYHGADVMIKDDQGETPLQLARRKNKFAAVELLEKRGACE